MFNVSIVADQTDGCRVVGGSTETEGGIRAKHVTPAPRLSLKLKLWCGRSLIKSVGILRGSLEFAHPARV